MYHKISNYLFFPLLLVFVSCSDKSGALAEYTSRTNPWKHTMSDASFRKIVESKGIILIDKKVYVQNLLSVSIPGSPPKKMNVSMRVFEDSFGKCQRVKHFIIKGLSKMKIKYKFRRYQKKHYSKGGYFTSINGIKNGPKGQWIVLVNNHKIKFSLQPEWMEN